MIKAINISKKFKNTEIFSQLNIEVPNGKITSLIGASGEGKSTLLYILGALDKPSSGEVFYNNKRIDDLNPSEINKIRNQQIGFVFQFHHLFPEFTALENICIPAWINTKNKNIALEKAQKLLLQLGLENKGNHKPKELSGGEQQRIAIARALINEPQIILADEPTGNLDAQNAFLLFDIFQQLNQNSSQSFFIVTHNSELAKKSHHNFQFNKGILYQNF